MTYLFAALSMIFFALWIRERRKLDDCEFKLELEKNWERRYHEMNEAHTKNRQAYDRLINTSNNVVRSYRELMKTKDIYIGTLEQSYNAIKNQKIELLNLIDKTNP